MVRIEVVNNRLRLRWTHSGKRYCLSLNLTNTTTHYAVAQQKATQIELDIISGNFDATLTKYKAQGSRKQTPPIDLFRRYAEYKIGRVHKHTHCNYRAAETVLRTYVSRHRGKELNTEHFLLWYRDYDDGTSLATKVMRVRYLRAAYRWALSRGLVPHDPWSGVDVGLLKPQMKTPPRPLATEEIRRIAGALDPRYLDFFLFLVGTGCRVGEAAGLRWDNVSSDFSSVWVVESHTAGLKRPVKCGKPRVVVVSVSVSSLLERRHRESTGEYVFTSVRGGPMNTATFRKLVWTPTLETLDIPYRSPYVTRCTFISHALSRGVAPVLVAQQTGHSLEVLYKHYAGDIKASPIPDILGDLE